MLSQVPTESDGEASQSSCSPALMNSMLMPYLPGALPFFFFAFCMMPNSTKLHISNGLSIDRREVFC